MKKKRSILLRPSLRSQYQLLFWGILLLPLFGTGLILLFLAWRRRASVSYEVFDKSIRFHETDKEKTDKVTEIFLSDIVEVNVESSLIAEKLGVGDVLLVLSGSEAVLKGIKKPIDLSDMIRHAAAAERKRLEMAQRRDVRTPDQGPGTLDRMNDLTSMWQQGLITDEEFDRERKHFE